MNIQEYKVVLEKDAKLLEKQVAELMEEEWQPMGGVSIAWDSLNAEMHFSQAMVLPKIRDISALIPADL